VRNAAMTALLLRTPAPYPTESPRGYVLRVSETNGYDTPWHILTYAGFGERKMHTAAFPLEKLAAVLGKELSELAPISPNGQSDNGGREFQILGHSPGKSLPHGPLRLAKPAFCTHCAEEDGFIDAFWDLSLAVACPRHRCTPAYKCAGCGGVIRWYRPGILRCRCGAKLIGTDATEVSQGVIDLMSVLQAKLHGIALASLNNKSNMPLSDLEYVPLKALLAIIPALGEFNLSSRGTPFNISLAEKTTSAAEVFSNWPTGYHDFLRRFGVRAKASGVLASGVRKQFGPFYESMFKGRSCATDLKFLREEFVRFGLNEWGEGIVDTKLRQEEKGLGRFVSQSEIARQMGVRPITLRRWAQAGKIKMVELTAGMQKRYVADVKTLPIPEKANGVQFQTREAAAYVGVPVSVLAALRLSEHYSVKSMPKYKLGYHEADLNYFQKRLLDLSIEVEEDKLPSEPIFTLELIMQKLRFWSKTGKADFLAAYLDGKVKSVGRTGKTLQTIRFWKTDVDAYIQACRFEAFDGAVTQQAASNIIACDPQAIQGLIEQGYLVVRTGSNGMRIEPESAKNFSKVYVALASIAKEIGTSSVRLSRLCVAAAIPVLAIPRVHGGAVPFIQRMNRDTLIAQSNKSPARIQSRQVSEESGTQELRTVHMLRRYLASLVDREAPLPRLAGALNRAAIAKACGFDRNVLYLNKHVIEILNAFDAEDRQRHNVKARQKPELAVQKYLEQLRESKMPLPKTAGKPNKSVIARACGFRREVFYENGELLALLDTFTENECRQHHAIIR
jgi:hypothetical protein